MTNLRIISGYCGGTEVALHRQEGHRGRFGFPVTVRGVVLIRASCGHGGGGPCALSHQEEGEGGGGTGPRGFSEWRDVDRRGEDL